jgi:two-component system chemotaxis response regulator CheB
MPPRRIVVIGTSSGGVEALSTIARSLPGDLPGAVCVVMHTAPDSPGVLPAIIQPAIIQIERRGSPATASRFRPQRPIEDH